MVLNTFSQIEIELEANGSEESILFSEWTSASVLAGPMHEYRIRSTSLTLQMDSAYDG